MLTFDEAEHKYYWNGKRVPNVTSVLHDLVDYSHVPPDTLEYARQQGVAIHKMVELDVRGTLDADGLPDWLRPRYAAWLLFKRELRFTPVSSEKRVYHPSHRYAGTDDLEGWMHDDEYALIDVKRSLAMGDVIGLQTAAYSEAGAHERTERVKRRGALLLLPNGKYKYESYADKNDFNVFLACLIRHNFKEKRL